PHIPFQDQRVIREVELFMEELQPDMIVYPGDIGDWYGISSFDKNPSRADRLQSDLSSVGAMFKRQRALCPNARMIEEDGNHEDRLRRFIWRHPGVAGLRDLDLARLMRVEDTWEVLPYKSLVEYASLLIEHGDLVRQHAAYTAKAMFEKRGSSGIVGHTHRFGVYTRRDASEEYIYVENGCTCRLDPEYAPFPNWQQSFTYVIAYDPHHLCVIPVPITAQGFRAEGRWYGRKE
ncbi:hypothetical protein LCGC14_0816700, partial [marine sediment metagenome]